MQGLFQVEDPSKKALQGMQGAGKTLAQQRPGQPEQQKTAAGALSTAATTASMGATIGTAVSTGASAGPWGAAAGAAVGLASYYLM